MLLRTYFRNLPNEFRKITFTDISNVSKISVFHPEMFYSKHMCKIKYKKYNNLDFSVMTLFIDEKFVLIIFLPLNNGNIAFGRKFEFSSFLYVLRSLESKKVVFQN